MQLEHWQSLQVFSLEVLFWAQVASQADPLAHSTPCRVPRGLLEQAGMWWLGWFSALRNQIIVGP